ncbi:MAG TPA: TraR/DksA family transcriptional regulator [Casimicrobiaceae bacterium]|nr:TraR/DksA family transcriptional regulator [Casimicrobiaceae bacterium]
MEPLSEREHDTLSRRLAARREELRTEVQKQLANSDDPRISGFADELAAAEDWVLADILADTDLAMVTRDIAELGEVEAALGRVADGSYGTCSSCGEPIGWPRLNAQPTAQRCIRCQEAFERRRAGPGGA